MNLTTVENFLRRYRHADIIEAVVDTTCSNSATVPFLNLWAWKASGDTRIEDALVKVSETGDLGFLYDVLEEAGSSSFEIDVAEHYPDWPEGIAEGDASIIAALSSLVTPGSQRASGTQWFVFHHVDEWPLVDIGTRNAS